jgi:hypothetical protein
MKRKVPKKTYISRFVMHDAVISVWAVTNTDSSHIYYGWKKDGYITMHISLNGNWNEVVKAALHEVMELALGLFHAQYEPSFTALRSLNSDRYVFQFNHPMFCQITDHVGDMLAYLLPELKSLHDKIIKKNKGV